MAPRPLEPKYKGFLISPEVGFAFWLITPLNLFVPNLGLRITSANQTAKQQKSILTIS
jgi:hypothetical protein